MREAEFRAWMAAQGHSLSTQNTQITDAKRLETHFGDLDDAFDTDGLDTIRTALHYSKSDERASRPNPAPFPIDGNLYANLSHYRSTLSYYANFRAGSDRVAATFDSDDADKRVLLLDDTGTPHWPVRQINQQTGHKAFRIRGASNKTEDAEETTDIVAVARALLIEGKSVRVLRANNGRRPYLAYGKQKLISYEVTAEIAAALGIPRQGSVNQLFTTRPTQLSTSQERASEASMTNPTNLILYGPPGTGKTYATAAEAVRLCGETAGDSRDELMARYRELVGAGRIAFVTFHQNFSYEDFVEGLRPVPIENDDGNAAGFQLRPEPGLFQQIASRAGVVPLTSGDAPFALSGRGIYKMSLGDASDPGSAWVFEESLSNGYALFGFEDIDWSDPRFEDRGEILREALSRHPEKNFTPQTGPIQSTDVFRNDLDIDDLIIVTKGLSHFRAIGLVEGEYEYAPRASGRYSHRRKVRWLWSDPQGRRASDITPVQFARKTIYPLRQSDLDLGAISALIGQGGGEVIPTAPLPHVLIIDEINRANVSKVFGELITLIEPDKRLGMPNSLTLTLPYSRKSFGVPANLHIIGTMNTADRSIALLDTALRRRFTFREIAPEPQLLPEQIDGVPLRRLLDRINDRIEYLIDRDHRVGHAFFMACGSRDDIDHVMRDKVIPLLQEYFFEDWSRIHAVVGDGFIGRRDLAPPPGIEGDPRPSWFVRPHFSANAYDRLIAGSGAMPTPDDEYGDAAGGDET